MYYPFILDRGQGGTIDWMAKTRQKEYSIKKIQYTRSKNILPPFHNVKLSSIVHLHIYRFISIYMKVDNARKTNSWFKLQLETGDSKLKIDHTYTHICILTILM